MFIKILKNNGKCYSYRIFESIALCCAKYADSIPVVLFLGFFTATGKFCFCYYLCLRAVFSSSTLWPSVSTIKVTYILTCTYPSIISRARILPPTRVYYHLTETVMQRSWAVYAAIPGTGKIITLATYYLKRNNPEVKTNYFQIVLNFLITVHHFLT